MASEVPPGEARVLLLPPTSRDADAICKVLAGAGVHCVVCPSMAALCAELARGAGAVVVSEEVLVREPDGLSCCVRAQPVWSDVPVVVLSHSGKESPTFAALLAGMGNVSVLERPVRLTTMVSVVRSALRGRQRQYEVRDHLEERERVEAALKGGEERLSIALRTGRLGLWTVDLPTRTLTSTAIFKANYGHGPDDPFTYDDLWVSVHPDDRGRLQEQVRRAVADRSECHSEYRTIWPDGTAHWVLVRGRATYAADGTPLSVTGVSLDITERKVAEEQRAALLEAERTARAEAERASQIKDEFLATLSHELRTPLNAIVGWSQIIKSNPADATDVAEGIEIIERNARAQTQIIEDLLDMSRIVSGKVRMDVQRVDLASVLRAAAETVKPAADAKGVRVQTVIDPLAGPVSGDTNRLQQVFWNLLTNAVKFTPRGGRVQVVLERVNSHLEVSVIDTGEGIAPDFLPHVFDRFRQADATTTRRHGGLGLGLAIVKQLVELHGGSIRAKSPGAGRGSTFIVSLPLTAIHSDEEPAPERRHPTAGGPSPSSSSCLKIAGVRVLVVDDEPDARALVRRLLEDCEALVTTAASAQEAMEVLRAERPQVLVSDIGMPGEDGYALIRRVRALPPEQGGRTPAVALTAYARAEDRVKAVIAGFQHHVAKPVEPAELIAMVASVATDL